MLQKKFARAILAYSTVLATAMFPCCGGSSSSPPPKVTLQSVDVSTGRLADGFVVNNDTIQGGSVAQGLS